MKPPYELCALNFRVFLRSRLSVFKNMRIYLTKKKKNPTGSRTQLCGRK